jgi:hypothetical protein
VLDQSGVIRIFEEKAGRDMIRVRVFTRRAREQLTMGRTCRIHECYKANVYFLPRTLIMNDVDVTSHGMGTVEIKPPAPIGDKLSRTISNA